jgi:hypothetical protein
MTQAGVFQKTAGVRVIMVRAQGIQRKTGAKASIQHRSVGCEFRCPFSREAHIAGLSVQEFEVLVKDVLPEQVNFLQGSCVDEDSLAGSRMISQRVEQLIGRCPIEISAEADTKIVVFFLKRHFEIVRHAAPPRSFNFGPFPFTR